MIILPKSQRFLSSSSYDTTHKFQKQREKTEKKETLFKETENLEIRIVVFFLVFAGEKMESKEEVISVELPAPASWKKMVPFFFL